MYRCNEKLGRLEYGVNEDQAGYGDYDNESQQALHQTASKLAAGELNIRFAG